MTRNEILQEFHRLCENVNKAEEVGLLDIEEAQRMRDRYRDRADRALDALKSHASGVRS